MVVEERVVSMLTDPRIHFHEIDRFIVLKFDENVFAKIAHFYSWLEEEKEIAKNIVRDETGYLRLPKTPTRGYCFQQQMKDFTDIRKISKMAHDPHALKSSKHATVRVIKTEQKSLSKASVSKTPVRLALTPRKFVLEQQTPLKRMKNTPISPSRITTPLCTPVRNVATSRIVANAKSTVEKIVASPRINDKQITVGPKTVMQSVFKRSEVIRKIEKRANTVIKNKEELMKEKAERARRDREERALRVKMNNKKKEEEALEKLRLMKIREQQIEAIKVKQRASQRIVSKSPCRTRGYYSRMQKPLAFVGSLHDISTAKSAVKKEVLVIDKEKPKLHGKRNLNRSFRQSRDGYNKRCKLNSLESNTKSVTDRSLEEMRTPKKISSGKHVDNQTNINCAVDNCLVDNDEKKLRKSSSQSSIRCAEEQEGLTVNENISSADIMMESSVTADTMCEEEKNLHATSPNKKNDDAILNKNDGNDQTLEKSMDISVVESTNVIGNNYNIDDLSSNDETDDEDNPRKPIPLWAMGDQLRNALQEQFSNSQINPDVVFGTIQPPILKEIFGKNYAGPNKRTSSAKWSSPLSNPKVGTSKFFELQDGKTDAKL
ncbi:unnamed protein product [Thelazia callipaeda]|uniref:INCENP_ARK-bind domain-containing protein n=1 Tax=Thelazia callipaeda TaxID=103827 RepID=A0A0N5CVB8_THECL|nr:unnamed protein product [Thelazia callipaeda]